MTRLIMKYLNILAKQYMARLNGPTTEKGLRLYDDDDESDNMF